jgi:hypothetical protein
LPSSACAPDARQRKANSNIAAARAIFRLIAAYLKWDSDAVSGASDFTFLQGSPRSSVVTSYIGHLDRPATRTASPPSASRVLVLVLSVKGSAVDPLRGMPS